MKPRTKLQLEVFNLSQFLPKLTSNQKEWAYKECLDHKGYATKSRVICMDCGETFSTDLVTRKRAICPHCQTKIKIENSRKSTDKQVTYFAVTFVCWDYQIVRNFEIIATYKQGGKANYYLKEILQYWITPDEKVIMLGCTHHINGYCDSWGGEWGIKKESGYRIKYQIYPYKYAPESIFKSEYRRIGINHTLDGINVPEAIKFIPNNSYAETLLKTKQYELLGNMCQFRNNGQTVRNWSSIKICLRNKYKVKDASLWFDYLDLLRYFNRDLHNAKYVCPKNLKKEHDRFVKKKREIQRKRDLEKQRQQIEKAQINYIESKKPFIGLQFSKGKIWVKFLNSVQEVMEEGDVLKHCVFANRYYEKNTLLFSAIVNGKRMATVEVDPKLLKVVQVRGSNNNPTDYDHQIKEVINNHMDIINEKLSLKRKLQIAS